MDVRLQGAPNCLRGLRFVLSGVFESIDRDDAKALIGRLDGHVTTSISHKTDYVVVGRDAGESKLTKVAQSD